jgi:hypothetical protein
MRKIKSFLKALVPLKIQHHLIDIIGRYKKYQNDKKTRGLLTKDIFETIYTQKIWGPPVNTDKFSSGHGSHDSKYVDSYVLAVNNFIQNFKQKPNLVDLGCGDFNIGSKIRPYCNKYFACDIASSVIEFNIEKYKDLEVDFRCVDIIEDNLPEGNVVIIRQVLQHLSNEHILKVVEKLYQFEYLILSEYIPLGTFTSNIDQPTGAYSRIARGINSGVVLTDPPFSMRILNKQFLCSNEDKSGILETIVYKLK